MSGRQYDKDGKPYQPTAGRRQGERIFVASVLTIMLLPLVWIGSSIILGQNVGVLGAVFFDGVLFWMIYKGGESTYSSKSPQTDKEKTPSMDEEAQVLAGVLRTSKPITLNFKQLLGTSVVFLGIGIVVYMYNYDTTMPAMVVSPKDLERVEEVPSLVSMRSDWLRTGVVMSVIGLILVRVGSRKPRTKKS